MDENKLKKQLFQVTGIVIIMSIILCGLVFFVTAFMADTVRDAETAQMQIEAQEYKTRILKQIDKNFEILTTVAEVYEACNEENGMEILKKSSNEINNANSFITLAFFSTDGNGFVSTKGQGTKDYTLDYCNEEVQRVVNISFNGKRAVSKMFDSSVYDGKLFVYSVPVYKGDEVIGALSASDTLDIFEDIVNGNTVMGGEGYIHIISSSGDFLVRSSKSLVKENIDSIFDGPYLSGKDRTDIENALINEESYHGDFVYNGTKCHFYIEPLGLNGWYLFCVNVLGGYTLSYMRIFWIILAVFCIVLGIFLFLIYFGYYKFRVNSASLLRLVCYDSLTGAKNTFKFDEELQNLQKNTNKYSIIALNIHNFKGINDVFGRKSGDKVLCYIKDVIESFLNEGEFFCRDSADLFYITMLDTNTDRVGDRVEDIIYHVSQSSASYGGYSYEMLLYAGIAVQGDREKALVALQSIQHTRSKLIAFYNQNLHEEVRKRNSIESCMYQALQNKEFKMFLQPKFNLKTNELVGAEALVRWQKKDGTWIYPNEFIPLFESNGFCINLDLYMVERACEQIRKWIDEGFKPVPISINQSKPLFSDLNYADNIEKILEKYNVPSNLITLEILEGIVSDDLEALNRQINTLHSKGFKVSLDDFGSGYSSLNMLYRIYIDEIKLDRGFLRKFPDNNNEQRLYIILEQVIVIARKLGIKVVAEGIETQKDKENMLSLLCDYGQGYLFDKPMNTDEFSKKYVK